MTFPSNPQLSDWFANNRERFGQHRPSPFLIGASWRAGCGCAPGCSVGEDGYDYPDFETALDASRTNIAANEHGD